MSSEILLFISQSIKENYCNRLQLRAKIIFFNGSVVSHFDTVPPSNLANSL